MTERPNEVAVAVETLGIGTCLVQAGAAFLLNKQMHRRCVRENADDLTKHRCLRCVLLTVGHLEHHLAYSLCRGQWVTVRCVLTKNVQYRVKNSVVIFLHEGRLLSKFHVT